MTYDPCARHCCRFAYAFSTCNDRDGFEQSSERTGIGAVSGAAETFFGKSKARGMDAKLALVTKICTGIFVSLSIVMMMIG